MNSDQRTYLRAGQGTVTLTAQALTQVLPYRQVRLRDREACGVLLGRFMIHGHRIMIDSVTEPQSEDQRTRTTFRRSSIHQRFVDVAFQESGGTRVYLGEWHSHPQAHPNPSVDDLMEWGEKLRDPHINAEALLFVILGTRSLYVYEGDREAHRITRLRRTFTLP